MNKVTSTLQILTSDFQVLAEAELPQEITTEGQHGEYKETELGLKIPVVRTGRAERFQVTGVETSGIGLVVQSDKPMRTPNVIYLDRVDLRVGEVVTLHRVRALTIKEGAEK